MSKQSNSYIIVFMLILSVVSAVILSFVSESLKPAQIANIELEKKKSILNTFMSEEIATMKAEEINEVYDNKVKASVIDINGNAIDISDNEVNIGTEYRKDSKERKYPVYEIFDENGELEYCVLPFYGDGLYDDIWTYVAIEKDMETIKGVVLDNKGETPGLGARMSDKQIADRFKGKKIRDEQGKVVAITMMKGERGGGEASIKAFADQPHTVDGLSGATSTGKGISKMFHDYLEYYTNYLNSHTN